MALRWRAFPLHPDTPEEGLPLEQLFRTDTKKIQAMLAHLKEVADALGLPFGERSRTYNSRLAQELGLWAVERGRGNAFHHAAFTAYFAEGMNLAKREVLLELARRAGLPTEEAAEVLDSRSFREPVDRDWQEARRRGVTAVPTFELTGSRLVGARSYADLQGLMLQHGIGRRT